MRMLLTLLLVHGLLGGLFAGPARAADDTPLVVELFTSQGCSSCPPADAYLAELADRDDVLALSYHVDYWDYIGWRDPFSSAANTQRQRDYAHRLRLRYVYTPQIVVDGIREFTGSNRSAIEAALAERKSHGPHRPLSFTRDAASGALTVRLTTAWDCGGCDLWLVTYDDRHTTSVRRGENAGRELVNRHVVRRLEHLATWHGEAREITVARPGAGDAAAVLMQDQATGQIVAAARVALR